MCLVDSLPLLTVRVIRMYRRGDPGCGTSAPASRWRLLARWQAEAKLLWLP